MDCRAKQVILINWFRTVSIVSARLGTHFSNVMSTFLCSSRSSKHTHTYTYQTTRVSLLALIACAPSFSVNLSPFGNQFDISLKRFPLEKTAKIIIMATISSEQPLHLIFVLWTSATEWCRTEQTSENNHRSEHCVAIDMHFYWTFVCSECSKCTFYWLHVSVLQWLRFWQRCWAAMFETGLRWKIIFT